MGALFVLCTIWLYSSSLFITIVVLLQIFLALVLAYFIYVFVLSMDFFPFVNILTGVLLLAVGVDDAFVYLRIWKLAKSDKLTGTLERLVLNSLRHSTICMLATSATTAGALLSNLLSAIVSIRCFAVFSSLAVGLHLLLSVTWLPAAALLHDQYCGGVYPRFVFYEKATRLVRTFFDDLLPTVILRLRYFWIWNVILEGIIYPLLKISQKDPPLNFLFPYTR